MRHLGIAGDRWGKQAFAYLAVTLMVMSGAYISYLVWLERSSDSDRNSRFRMESVENDLDRAVSEIRMGFTRAHDDILLQMLDNSSDWNSSSVDSELESRLSDELDGILASLLGYNEKRGIIVEVTQSRLSVSGIAASHLMPSPDSGDNDTANGTGPTIYDWRPGSIGVNTTLEVEIRASSTDGITLARMVSVNIRRDSLRSLVIERMNRLEKALKGAELAQLYQHILGSLAEAKAYLGNGRDFIEGCGVHPDPLLTEAEMNACMDLAVHLLSSAYLGSFDQRGLESVEQVLRERRDSRGCSPSLMDMLLQQKGHYDPGLIPLVMEGLFSEECPPSADEIFRPILMSVIERLALSFTSFIGIGPELLSGLGGVFDFFRSVTNFGKKFVGSILGKEYLDEVDRAMLKIISIYYERSDMAEIYEGKIVLRSITDHWWDNDPIDDYPDFDPRPENRTFTVSVLNSTSPETGQCTISRYRIRSGVDIPRITSDFRRVDLRDDMGFLDGAASCLGADKYILGMELEAMEMAKVALREIMDDLLDELSSSSSEKWDRIWEGWGKESPPPLGVDEDPSSAMIGLSLGALPGFLAEMAPAISRGLTECGLKDAFDNMMSAAGDSLANYIFDNYDDLADKDSQIAASIARSGYQIVHRSKINVRETEYISTTVEDMEDVEGLGSMPDSLGSLLSSEPDLMMEAFNISDPDGMDKECIDDRLMEILYPYLDRSFETVKMREMGPMDLYNDTGVIRSVFIGSATRSGLYSIQDSGLSIRQVESTFSSIFAGIVNGVMNDTSMSSYLSASRYLLPHPGNDSSMKVRSKSPGEETDLEIPVEVNITTTSVERPFVRGMGGTYDPDPRTWSSPYRSHFRVNNAATYVLRLTDHKGNPVYRKLELSVSVELTTHTVWPMRGVEYQTGKSLLDKAMDRAKEAASEAAGALMNATTAFVGEALPSVHEVPPIVMDLIENSEIDLADVSRVLSNVTMDLSSTLREGIKDLVKGLIEKGLSELLSSLLDAMGADEFEMSVRAGPLDLTLSTEREALLGGEGSLVGMVCNIEPVGLHADLGINRCENSTIKFNGTVTVSIGKLYLRMELDPFMEDRPHMISVEGYYGEVKGDRIRFSFCAPSLEEYRSTELSLSSSLGISPTLPIPPLGIQAVFDGGFRLRYRMPDEVPPVLNEVHFQEMNLTWIEIYDPRLLPFSGSTLEIRDGNDVLIRSWLISESPSPYVMISLDQEDTWRSGPGSMEDGIHIVLKSPAGILMDDIWVDEIREGAFARDMDGYGVWRWGDGTPGSSNGGSSTVDIRSLIISMALSSIKEAWEEALDLYGISFDTVVHFLQRALDLFMERFISMISELVLDLRLFISVEVEDASGSAGAGLELSLNARGEAVAMFLEWLYENIRIMVSNMADPQDCGDMRSFPVEILELCSVSLMVFTEVETPVSVGKFAPEGADIPDSLTLGVQGEVNLALPLELLGKDVGDWHVSFGVKVMDAPAGIVSIFYDVSEISATSDLWLIRGEIWEEQYLH